MNGKTKTQRKRWRERGKEMEGERGKEGEGEKLENKDVNDEEFP